MEVKHYLKTPCPRCGKNGLQRPEPSGHRLYSACAVCGRKSLYVIHEKIDGSKSYSIVPVGAKNNGMVRVTFWITKEHKEMLKKLSFLPRMQSQIVRQALDNYSHTLQVKS